MSLTRRDVEHIAHLARLAIDEAEIEAVTAKLAGILDFVAELTRADTDGVAPMAHPLDMVQRLRADAVTETDHRERYQRNAADVVDGLYRVPRVID